MIRKVRPKKKVVDHSKHDHYRRDKLERRAKREAQDGHWFGTGAHYYEDDED